MVRDIHRLLPVLLIAVCAPSAFGDAIIKVQAMTASTIAEYFIEEEGVRVELEIGFVDLPAFSNLMPDPIYEPPGPRSQAPVRPVAGFLQGRIRRCAGTGAIRSWAGIVSMEARDRIKRDEITGEPVPVSEEEREPVIFAELFYPFEERPAILAIGQLSRSARAGIGFVTYHQGLPVNDFRYLGDTYVLDLDWNDPWYSSFRSRPLRRNYYAAMNGFIYVEPYEVRKEIIVRPKDLQGVDRSGPRGKDHDPRRDPNRFDTRGGGVPATTSQGHDRRRGDRPGSGADQLPAPHTAQQHRRRPTRGTGSEFGDTRRDLRLSDRGPPGQRDDGVGHVQRPHPGGPRGIRRSSGTPAVDRHARLSRTRMAELPEEPDSADARGDRVAAGHAGTGGTLVAAGSSCLRWSEPERGSSSVCETARPRRRREAWHWSRCCF